MPLHPDEMTPEEARREALFDEIPAELRAKSLGGIPAALSEMEVGRMMLERAAAIPPAEPESRVAI